MKKLLVIGIIILLVGMSVPSTGINVEKSTTVSFNGNTLYVGGSGPGNYTKIQDAIDNASDGDTVFVYDDSSPYFENLSISHSITLMGEGQSSTIISGFAYAAIRIYAPNVTIRDFTIENPGDLGILIRTSDVTITHAIFQNIRNYGIEAHTRYGDHIIERLCIQNNTFYGPHNGFYGFECNELIIANNTFSEAKIEFHHCFHASIFHNHFTSSWGFGYFESLSGWNHIYKNEFRNCDCAIRLIHPGHDLVEMNNFVKNTRDVSFSRFFIAAFFFKLEALMDHDWMLWGNYSLFSPTVWRENYWGRSLIHPKILFGSLLLFYIISYYFYPLPIGIPLIRLDRHPAIKPYDI